MSFNDYDMAHYSEDLCFTSEGKFKLEIEGQRDYTKTLTPKQTERWLKKRYPRWSWNRMLKSANRWLEHETLTKPSQTGFKHVKTWVVQAQERGNIQGEGSGMGFLKLIASGNVG